MLPVKNKKEFVKRYEAGEFGNASPTWQSVKEWDNLQRLVDNKKYHLRNRIPGGKTFYNIKGWMLNYWANNEKGQWVHNSEWYVSEMAPTELTLIQGEVSIIAIGLCLHYSTVRKPMRDALAENSHHLFGLSARVLLQKFMDTNSYEWLNHLLVSYPDHVIEFSTYSKCWGTVPGFNTVFWETRQY